MLTIVVIALIVCLGALALFQAVEMRRLRLELASAEAEIDGLNAALGERVRFVEVQRLG